MIAQYDFFRTKYGEELLIDLIDLKDLGKYIELSPIQRLSYYDITVITEGNGTFSVDDHEHQIKHGCIYFSSPGQIRKWNTSRTPKGYVLIFEDEFLCAFFNDKEFTRQLSFFNHCGNTPVVELMPDDLLRLTGLLQEIKTEIQSFNSNDTHILRALLYQTLVFLNRKYDAAYPLSSKKPTNRHMEQFAQMVETSCFRERSVAYYAEKLHITSGHLTCVVKEHYGISAKKYILNKTMLEAKKLLRYTDMSIAQIAEHLHFENTTYFSKIFRDHAHITPMHFRKQPNP